MARTTDLAVALHEARLNLGLNTQDAADKIGVARSTVYKWERGLPPHNRAMLTLIEEAYGLDRGTLKPLWERARRTRRRPPRPTTETA